MAAEKLSDRDLAVLLLAEADFFTLQDASGEVYRSRLGELLAAASHRIGGSLENFGG